MTENDIQLFNDSLERCTANPDFLGRFYEIFVAASPEIAAKFKSTNFSKQKRMLKASLYLLIYAVEGKPEGLAHLNRMAEVHGPKGFGIQSWMYDAWFDCLLKAVKEFDPRFFPETEAAWQSVLQEGIDYMKARSS